MLQKSSKSRVFGCKGIECFVLAKNRDEARRGQRYRQLRQPLLITTRENEIEHAPGFPGLKMPTSFFDHVERLLS